MTTHGSGGLRFGQMVLHPSHCSPETEKGKRKETTARATRWKEARERKECCSKEDRSERLQKEREERSQTKEKNKRDVKRVSQKQRTEMAEGLKQRRQE